MIELAVLVPEGAVPQAVADVRYLFQMVEAWQSGGSADAVPRVKLYTLGARRRVALQDGAFSIDVDRLLSEKERYDLILVPPCFGDLDQRLAQNQQLVPWLLAQRAAGAELASLCVGAFLLAETGLLAGLSCSTHWAFADELARRHPSISYAHGKIVTFSDGIYTSGGAQSIWMLLLHLVERFYDREASIRAAKYFGVDYGRQSQEHLSIFEGQRRHDDALVHAVQDAIERQYAEPLTVDSLAQHFLVGRRTLERRFRAATHNSVMGYVQRVRIERARALLEQAQANIDQVAERVGYQDRRAFSELFARHVAMSPAEYRRRYRVA